MKNFFLEGDKFVGKSTLLQEVIRATGKSISGFYVKRRIGEQGQIVGFELRAAKELLQKEANLEPIDEHCFIQTENGKRTRNLQVFETWGKFLLEEAKTYSADLILLDEIGGIELLSQSFTNELLTMIQQPQKIVGVFKSDVNYQRQKKHTIEKLEIGRQRAQLKQTILKNEGQILALNEHNFAEIKMQLSEFLKR
ncbi:hypothetical protein A5819_002473 [Enterococcus sp. 7E2_DIV0204]|uniref:Nucleoside-triphosphatase n=1 Tax=Candidatus Enterococcus lemimoniae TaxID=1834167 RepID=A0ABZ2T4X5_9ENTE|nr:MULTISPECIES: nucleoside-triphosphatase [unclassified Enterococcus]OTN89975.1 hypothetical protein A5819_002473 [Enterococcus sp. 7E2_DIV0204]OTO68833.1 hypothetical protein A5866_001031 [Enterococcus sp. 12C11_DIV0727]OTP52432.1 hypothetical protein A5884_001633 [Enterococcus sp. 7D2_DIV0200]